MIVELTLVGKGFDQTAYINMDLVRVIRPHFNAMNVEFAELHFSDGWTCIVRETCDQIIGDNHRKAKKALEKAGIG